MFPVPYVHLFDPAPFAPLGFCHPFNLHDVHGKVYHRGIGNCTPDAECIHDIAVREDILAGDTAG